MSPRTQRQIAVGDTRQPVQDQEADDLGRATEPLDVRAKHQEAVRVRPWVSLLPILFGQDFTNSLQKLISAENI
jgi:hypothetical protein